MPTYEIFVRCTGCSREHPIHFRIHLEQGPDRKQSVAEFFGKDLMPPQVASLQSHKALCLRTGKTFYLENDEQILLMPI